METLGKHGVTVKSIVREFDNIDIHVLPPDSGQYIYCGGDIAEAVGFNVEAALCDIVDDVDKEIFFEERGGEITPHVYINERGVKSLLPLSRISKKFKKWFYQEATTL